VTGREGSIVLSCGCCFAALALRASASLPTADGMHDLDTVAGCKLTGFVLAPRQNVFVELERNALAGQIELREQIGNSGLGGESVRLTVKNDFHLGILTKLTASSLPASLKGA